MKRIICFGDSITEMGFSVELRGFVAQLADRYARRADVIARGFSGYTTREAVKILKRAVLDEKPDFVVVFFGANDSAMPGHIQHVPIKEYRRNLQDMASQIACAGAWLVLVTPPPADGRRIKNRELDQTALYAQACRDVAREMQLPLVDIFQKMLENKDWTKTYLLDGLHLSAAGMNCLYDELAAALDRVQKLDQFDRLGVDGI